MSKTLHTTLLLSSAVLLSSVAHAQSTTQIKVNGVTYTTFAPTLDATTGAHVFLNANADASQTAVRATQRALGYREVAYKAALFNTLAFSAPAVTSTEGGTLYDFGTQSTKTTVVGYWANKDVPIVIGPDGNAYITDGHHTTAGFLQTNLANPSYLIPGYDHMVIGHVIASYYDPSKGPVAPTDAFWTTIAAANNAFLYATAGNQLALPADAGYAGLQPMLPSASTMPKVPGNVGTTAMVNDVYRSLTWGMADGIVKSALDSSGKTVKGFAKVNSLSTASTQPDINFVEFFWADYLRNRIVWDDTAAGTALGADATKYATAANGQANLIAAPISFFAAVANANALAKSEVYKDQFGRNISDYTGTQFSDNTRTWAGASIKNGLAKSGDTYHMYLLDNSTVAGDITPSGLAGVTNLLHIDTTAGQTIAGALKNFATISVNAGASFSTNWKDNLPTLPNSLLTIPAGTGAVVFTGANDYTKLTSLAIAAGSLEINNPADTSITAVISGAGAFIKGGSKVLTLTGTHTLSGNTTVKAGTLAVTGSLATSRLTVKSGATLSGTGTVGTTVNEGNIAPGGSSVGTMTIAGDYTQSATGSMTMQIAGTGAGQYDRIVVQGAAHLGGTLVLENISGYVPKDGDSYSFLSATSVDGVFSSVVNPLRNALGYRITTTGGNLLFNVLVVQNSFVSFATNANQLAAAKALDTTVGDTRVYSLFNRLNTLGGSVLPATLQSLSPDAYVQASRMALSLAESSHTDLRGHFSDLRSGIPSSGEGVTSRGWGLFASGSLQSGNFDAKTGSPKVDFDSHLYGAGLDYRLDRGFVLGLAVGNGQVNGDTDAVGSDARIRRQSASLFASAWSPSRLYFGLQLSQGWTDYRVRRVVLGETLSAAPDGTDTNVGLVLGKEWKYGNLQPRLEASVDFNNQQRDAATESAGLASLAVTAGDRDTQKSRVGGSLAYTLDTSSQSLRPYVSAFWVNQARDLVPSATASLASGAGSAFTALAPLQSRNSLEVGAGLSSNLTTHCVLSAGYEGTFNSDFRIHRFDVRASYQF